MEAIEQAEKEILIALHDSHYQADKEFRAALHNALTQVFQSGMTHATRLAVGLISAGLHKEGF